jgi:hypothetical protein
LLHEIGVCRVQKQVAALQNLLKISGGKSSFGATIVGVLNEA